MSNSEQIQNSMVNMVETFEVLQSQLEEKHFGKVIEEESDLENVTEEQILNCTEEFLDSMQETFEGIGEDNLAKLVMVVGNVKDALDAIYDLDDDFDDEDDDEDEPEADPSPDAIGAVNGNSSN